MSVRLRIKWLWVRFSLKDLQDLCKLNVETEFQHSFYTSPQIDSTKDNRSRGMKTIGINVRAVNSFRSIGVSYTPLTKLCGFLNMPPPMTKNAYDDLSYSIEVASLSGGEKYVRCCRYTTWNRANRRCLSFCRWYVAEKRFLVNTWGSDSYFYWQWESFRCSYSSKSCKGCTSVKKIASSEPACYETWKLSHNCNHNYTDFSPGMETAGATKIFSSSKEKHELYYTSFYRDGDSQAYPAVKDICRPSEPIKTFDCVGHYQKRVASRLCNMKKKTQKDWEKKENSLMIK